MQFLKAYRISAAQNGNKMFYTFFFSPEVSDI